MPTSFRPYEPEQSFLLPPSPREWLPEDHLAYFISDTIEALDLSLQVVKFARKGAGPYLGQNWLRIVLKCDGSGRWAAGLLREHGRRRTSRSARISHALARARVASV